MTIVSPLARNSSPTVLDAVGIGIGPFNLSLAALSDGVDGLATRFFDAKSLFSWHPGMMVDGAVLQVSFLADLVSLTDPTSRWSYLNYLRTTGRIYGFYLSEHTRISRREYSEYCAWVSRGLDNCEFGKVVLGVEWIPEDAVFELLLDDGVGNLDRVRSRNVIIGVGTSPSVPTSFPGTGPNIIHSSDYLLHRDEIGGSERIAVVGSGQSGAEIVLDLLRNGVVDRGSISWITRSSAFAPMEQSKFGVEHFTPDYIRYFYGLSEDARDDLVGDQWQLYKAASVETLNAIFDFMYLHRPSIVLAPNVEVSWRPTDGLGNGVTLGCMHRHSRVSRDLSFDRVVLATGYKPTPPPLGRSVLDALKLDSKGRFAISPDYRLVTDSSITGSIFVQNAEVHTHGVGAPDLGLGAHRSAVIVNSISGRECYPLPDRTAFTSFGMEDLIE